MATQHPRIVGGWTPVDDSTHCIEIAPTERQEVLAMRDTFDPNGVLYATPTQLRKLADAVQQGQIQHLR